MEKKTDWVTCQWMFLNDVLPSGIRHLPLERQIEAVYEDYLAVGNSPLPHESEWRTLSDKLPTESVLLNALIPLCRLYAMPAVSKQLSTIPGAFRSELEDILQEGDLGLAVTLRKMKLQGESHPNFPALVHEVYRCRRLDYLKHEVKKDDMGRIVQTVPVSGMSTPDEEGGSRPPEEHLPDPEPSPHDRLERTERKLLSVRLVQAFAAALLTMKGDVEKNLACCYCRILYQLDCTLNPKYRNKEENHDPKTINGTVFALREMNHKTRTLVKDSQGRLSQYGIRAEWALETVRQLDDRLNNLGTPLGDLIYTQTYSSTQIDRWATKQSGIAMGIVYARLVEHDIVVSKSVEDYLGTAFMQRMSADLKKARKIMGKEEH